MRILKVIFFCVFIVSSYFSFGQAPSNDDFTNPIDLTGLINSCSTDAQFTTLNATPDLNAGSCWGDGSNSNVRANVWFSFVATATGTIQINLDRGDTKGDLRFAYLALWDADCVTELACGSFVDAHDDISILYSGLTSGNTYHISVDNQYISTNDDFTLCLSDQATNDYLEGATNIDAYMNGCSADAEFSTQGATRDLNAASCWPNVVGPGPYRNVWFEVTAPASGTIEVKLDRGDAKGELRTAYMALWEPDGTTEVACNTYRIGHVYDDLSMLATGLTAGDTYYISVDNTYIHPPSTFTLCLSDQPTNDYYEGATDVTSFIGGCSPDEAYTTLGATFDRNTGSCWPAIVNHNKWFKFTAPSTGRIEINLDRGGVKGTLRHAYMALWDTDGLTELACTTYAGPDDDLSMQHLSLTPGTEYYFSVDNRYVTTTETFTLCLDALYDYDFYEGALDVTSLINSCSADEQYTTVGATPDRNGGSEWNSPDAKSNRWFQFTAPANGQINITVDIGGVKGTQRYSQVALWEADGVTEIRSENWYAQFDDVNLGHVGLTPGDTYYISVDSHAGSSVGTFTLCLSDQLDYDFYEGAIDITSFMNGCSADAIYSTDGASHDRNMASEWQAGGPVNNRWFRFDAPATGEVRIRVARGGSAGDQRFTQLALWEADGVTELASDRFYDQGDQVDVNYLGLTPGDTYYVSVDSYAGQGTFTMCINDQVDYDFYEGAINVTPFINTVSQDAAYNSRGASPDRNAGSTWPVGGARQNRWFYFVAPDSPTLNIKVDIGGVKGTQTRTLMALWEQDGLTEVSSAIFSSPGDDVEILASALTPGQIYYVSVTAATISYMGSFSLELSTDNDTDGINDIDDLDDDNDGIPDSVEGCRDTDIAGTIGIGNNVTNATYSLDGTDVTYTLVNPNNAQITGYDAGLQGMAIRLQGAAGDTGSLTSTYSNPIAFVGFKMTDFDNETRCTIEVYDENNVIYDLTVEGVVSVGSAITQTGNLFVADAIDIDGDDPVNDPIMSILFYFQRQVSRIVLNFEYPSGSSTRFTQPIFCSLDSDGDGIINNYDLDSDNDGLLDTVEADHSQSHTNGVVNGSVSTDGIPDSVQAAPTDGMINYTVGESTDDTDSIYDFLDLDSDGDGIPDNVEAQTTIGYVAPNADDADTFLANDGVNSAYLGGLIPTNTDTSDNPDFLDTDSDNEGGNDTAEAGITLANNDVDNDGLDDATDTTNDYSDVGGTIDHPLSGPVVLPDTDNDAASGGDVDFRDAGFNTDTDGDGVDDAVDLDDDNDGILDSIENSCSRPNLVSGQNLGSDVDEIESSSLSITAGIQYQFDSSSITTSGVLTGIAVDGPFVGEEINILLTNPNFGGVMLNGQTAVYNSDFTYYASESANNTGGLSDKLYVYYAIVDVNSNGTYENGIDELLGRVDPLNDGIIPAASNSGTLYFYYNDTVFVDNLTVINNYGIRLAYCDFDLDGIGNQFDLDSDDDGIPDNVEAQTTIGYVAPNADDVATYIANDGVNSAYLGGLTPTNSDTTDNPDYLDLDSDNEGSNDTTEAGITLANNDADNDGLDDATDATNDYSDVGGTIDDPLSGPVVLPDTDNDAASGGDVDFRDSIDDSADNDGDGIADAIDIDDDNDGIPDIHEQGVINSCSQTFLLDGAHTVDNYTTTQINTTASGISYEVSTVNGVLFDTSVSPAHNNSVAGTVPPEFQNAQTHLKIPLVTDMNVVQQATLTINFPNTVKNPTIYFSDLKDTPGSSTRALYYELQTVGAQLMRVWGDPDFYVTGNRIGTTLDDDTYNGTGLVRINGLYNQLSFTISYFSGGTTAGLNETSINIGYYDCVSTSYTANADTDGDGIINAFDLDSDNDGILDAIEAGHGQAHTLGEVNGTIGLDGLPDAVRLLPDYGSINYTIAESADDIDLNPNFLDLDSDGDGIPDNVEVQTTIGYIAPIADSPATYQTNDGVNSAYLGGLNPTNTDGADNPDYLDLDSDNEGGNDIAETQITLLNTDSDNDGLDDATDADLTGYADPGGIIDDPLSGAVILIDSDNDANSGGDVDFRDSSDDRTDTDNDGLADAIDLDDDNDGLTDSEELSFVIATGQPDCTGETTLDFSSVPTLESGIALVEGAVYRFPNVAAGIDALVTIDRTFNASVADIDNNSAEPQAFRPRTAFDIVNIGKKGFIEYRIQFVTTGLTTPVIIPKFLMNVNDTDGNVDYSEEIGMYDPSHYTLSNPTELTMTTDTPWLIATGGTTEYTGAGNTFPQVNFGTTYLSRSEIYVRAGISTIVPAAAASGREHNIDFRCTTNYINPVTYGIDIDGDGIGNHIDLDSDNDGILDAVEAGHGQAHTNGVVNGAVDSDGIPDAVQGTPNSGTVNYTVAESADDADLSPNYLDLDSDGDGIPDNVEAQTTIGYIVPNDVFDGNGLDTAYPSGITPTNTDGADNPDYLDTDSDNEGGNDTLEAAITLSGNDADNDGLDDATDEDITGFADAGGTIDDPLVAPIILPDTDLDATLGGDVDYRDATDDRPDNDNDGIPNVVDLDDDNDGILDSDELACSEAINDFNSMWNFGTGNGADASGSGTLNGVPYTLTFNVNGGSKLFSTTSQHTSNSTLGHGGNPGSLIIGGGSATGTNGESLTLVFASEVDVIVGFDHINDLTNVNEGWLFDIPADEVISMVAMNRIIGSGSIDGFELAQTGPLNTEVAYFLWNDVTSLTFTGQAETAATLGFNSISILCDIDNDGIPNHWDLDSDNDGILDVDEAGHGLTHTNGILNGPVGADGVPDSVQSDPDGGLTNYTIAESADDIDAIPNFLDLDADGDGIPDNVEAQTTIGYIAPNDAVDANGIDTAYTSGITPTNTDGADNPDYLDTNSDNEGGVDTMEANITLTGNDIDNDGLDDATDATPDYTDVGGTIDDPLSGAVILPDVDSDATTGGDVDFRDATDDSPDTDNDGVPDTIDLDDDNDGILDTVEGGLDPDGDLIINSLDLDSDNDGIPDNVEAQTTVGYVPPNADDAATYLANNGVNSAYLGGLTPTNTDGADNPDYLDTDSDNEGANDTTEAAIVLTGNDADNDGLDDATDATADYTDVGGTIDNPLQAPVILPDADADATTGGDVDFRDAINDAPIDLDSDDDGILDSFEDWNIDGDNDPSTDPTNSDGDAYPDYLDIDSDDDGIPDNVEAQTTSGYIPPSLIDTNNNGLDDAYENGTDLGIIPVNTDGMDMPDFLDDDSDNDGVPDNIEGHDHNQDGFADIVFIGSDKDDDGLDDNYEGIEQIDIDVNDEIDDPINDLPNTDGDAESDYRDMDDDDDGIPTMGEDMNGDMDYSNDDWDNDGIPDYLDPDVQSDDELEVYNVITANGDGIHDVLTIRSIENYPNNDIQVYNRWGILVFETTAYNNQSNNFDGRSRARATVNNGELLPIGTYFYIFNYEDQDGSMKQLSGHLYIN